MIHKSLWLPCDVARAFAIFTQEAGQWWPVDRRHTSDSASMIVFEPMGRFIERARDGHEVELGRVITWDPPSSLIFTFYPGTDVDHPTRVTVDFVRDGAGTRVSLTHGPTAASLALFDQRAPRYETSWTRVFEDIARHMQA